MYLIMIAYIQLSFTIVKLVIFVFDFLKDFIVKKVAIFNRIIDTKQETLCFAISQLVFLILNEYNLELSY